MTTLASRLPKPDPYAGMGMNEKLRLLQSTLTPAQWRIMGSEAGIGAGDLDRKQRDLFLSLLPDPFVVWPTRRGKSGERILYFDVRANGLTLTPGQRQGVRLSLRRVMNWSFRSIGSDGSVGIASFGNSIDDGGAQYEIHNNGFGSNYTGNSDEVFGVPLLEEVPARLKPGQLPFSWTALDAPVSLDGAATVGELVRRVAAGTRVPIFCDPRYADLSVYTRSSGTPVRAGDLLQALCLAVTGTFRKVDGRAEETPAYVLTDDLEGLGARHARLQAWASANAALAEQRREDVADALAKASIRDYVGWSEGDPSRPGADLDRTIEAFRKNRSNPGQSLTVPVSDLPAQAQERVRRQLEGRQKSLEASKNDPFFAEHPEAFPSLETDRVVMDVQSRASFVVPGMGAILSQGGGYSSDAAQSLLAEPRRRPPLPGPMFTAPAGPVKIPSTYEVRALIVAPQSEDEARRAVTAAKNHGLNQVWVEVVPDETGTSAAPLAAAIAAGQEAKVSVGAVVRLLRVRPVLAAPAALPADRNIAGETTTTFAARRSVVPFTAQASLFTALSPPQDAARLKRLGDWLAPNEPGVRSAAEKRALAIAAMPGLSGIVLRDVAAPGYDGVTATYSPLGTLDGGEQMGYTEPMRLAFLRESGVDPIDLSPLPQGKISLPSGGSSYPFLDMQLPSFPDYGPSQGSYSINGRQANELGAKTAADRWDRFRAAKTDALTESVVRAIRAHQPEMTVRVQRGRDLFDSGPLTPYFDLWKKPLTSAVGAKSGQPSHSAEVLFTVRCAPLSADTRVPATGADSSDPAAKEFLGRLSGSLMHPAKGWKGIVLDLSEVSVDRALTLLGRLQP